MPIRFDRYPVPQGGQSTARPVGGIPENINVPVIGPARLGLAQVSASVADLADTVGKAALARKALVDQTTLAERYMQASQDMDTLQSQIQSTPDWHPDAPTHWDKSIANYKKTWHKGLSPDLAQKLDRELVLKEIGYQRDMRGIQTRHHTDKAKASVIVAQARMKDSATRHLDWTDRQAFEELENQRNPDGTPKLDSNGLPVPGKFEQMLAGYAALGHLGVDPNTAKVQILKSAREETALARAQRIAVDDPDRYLRLMAQEERGNGSTFLKYMDPNQRNQMLQTAKDKKLAMQHEIQRQQNQKRAELEKNLKKQGEVFYGRARDELQNGTLGVDRIRDGVEMGLLTGAEAGFLFDGVQQQGVEGGPGRPEVIQKYNTAIHITNDPVALRDEVLRTRLSDFPLKHKQAALHHLEEKIKALDQASPSNKELHTAAKQMYQEALKVTGLYEKLNQGAQQVLVHALEELDRNMMNGFPENPMQLYFARVNDYRARVMSVGMERLAELKRDLKSQKYSNVEDKDQRLLDLEARRSSFKTPDAYLSELRRLKEMEDLEEQVARFRTPPAAQTAPQQQQPVGPARSSTTPPPIRPGSRSK